MNEKIIARVNKLIALAQNAGATDGERDNAMRMAHATLAKYNLKMGDLQDFTETPEERTELNFVNYNHKFNRTICNAIAKLYFCTCYFKNTVPLETSNAKKKCTYFFVGKESNVLTAKLMAEYLMKSIESERVKTAQGVIFNIGAANAIYWRVHDIIENNVENKEFSESTALAIVNLHKSEADANDEFIRNKGLKLEVSKNRKTKINDWESFNKGREFGNKINLSGQIAGKKQAAIE